MVDARDIIREGEVVLLRQQLAVVSSTLVTSLFLVDLRRKMPSKSQLGGHLVVTALTLSLILVFEGIRLISRWFALLLLCVEWRTAERAAAP